MRRLVDLSRAGGLALLVPAVAVAVPVVGIAQASAGTVDVCRAAAGTRNSRPPLPPPRAGDKIKIGPGTYAGGVTIDVSVKLVGAGPSRTIISGGGPVLTNGLPDAPREPTVRIDGVTVTGGVWPTPIIRPGKLIKIPTAPLLELLATGRLPGSHVA